MTRGNRMRIGVEFHPQILGGTENFLRRLFRHLDPMFTPVAIGFAPGAWQAFLDDTETHVVPYLLDDETPADVAGALRALRLDLVQSSCFSPVMALAAAQISLPHIWRLGGHVSLIDRTERERSHFLAIVQMTSRRVICPSRFLLSQLPPMDRGTCSVIYNGIDLDELAPRAGAAADAPPRVAMLAHLVPSKRHEVFLRAVRRVANQLPEVRFSIFGAAFHTPDLEAYAASVHTLVHQLDLDDVVRIEALGSDRFDRLSAIDVVAFPGVQEGASNAILEAMALGRAVVASDSGGNAELIADGVSGVIVPPDDADALADVLIGLLRDPARRKALGAAARLRIEGAFDIQQCARRYEYLYRDVLGFPPVGLSRCVAS